MRKNCQYCQQFLNCVWNDSNVIHKWYDVELTSVTRNWCKTIIYILLNIYYNLSLLWIIDFNRLNFIHKIAISWYFNILIADHQFSIFNWSRTNGRIPILWIFIQACLCLCRSVDIHRNIESWWSANEMSRFLYSLTMTQLFKINHSKQRNLSDFFLEFFKRKYVTIRSNCMIFRWSVA